MLGIDGKKVDWANMPLTDMLRGNALDSYFTLKVFIKLWNDIKARNMTHLYNNLISPAISMFTDIEMLGMDIDRTVVDSIGKQLEEGIFTVEEKLLGFKEVISKDLSLTSTKDLTAILYSCDKNLNIIEGGFNLYPPVATDKGAPSTSAEALETLIVQIEQELARRGHKQEG